jgi:hypothetical protein
MNAIDSALKSSDDDLRRQDCRGRFREECTMTKVRRADTDAAAILSFILGNLDKE